MLTKAVGSTVIKIALRGWGRSAVSPLLMLTTSWPWSWTATGRVSSASGVILNAVALADQGTQLSWKEHSRVGTS